jgi:hypothetical protein
MRPVIMEEESKRAEYHLNQGVPGPRTLALMVGALVLLLAKTAGAAPPSGCDTPLKSVRYAAHFEWPQAGPGEKNSLQLLIGSRESSKTGETVAQIWSGNQCQLSCLSTQLDPTALELKCRSAQLGMLTTSATVLWNRDAKPGHEATLRFGTWLEGYEQAPLRVEIDHFFEIANPRTGRLASRAPGLSPAKMEP